MVDFETNEIEQARQVGPLRGMADNVAGIASDAASLAELQVQLAKADLDAVAEKSKVPMVLAALGGSLLIGSMPVLTFALASLLTSQTGMAPWLSQLLVGSLSTLLAVATIVVAIVGLTRAAKPLDRSFQELRNNLAWLRSAVGKTQR